MLSHIYDAAQVSAAQAAFENRFRAAAATIATVNVGYQGGSVQLQVGWLPSVNIWSGSRKLSNRYWNAFGIGQPHAHNSNSIICEVNFALSGTNSRIQGVLAKDEHGTISVCHRGGIGGGKKGVGQNLFWQEFPGKWVSVSGDRVASIGAIEAPDFLDQVSNFVKFVQQIKSKNTMKAAVRY
jgi:5-methylcytosine-specific restriction enzyme A